jgi:hypothetical protein
VDRYAGAAAGAQHARRVAGHIGGASEQRHLGAQAALAQQPGDDEAVAAVVALAGDDQRAPPLAAGAEAFQQRLRRAPTGALHQHMSGVPRSIVRRSRARISSAVTRYMWKWVS